MNINRDALLIYLRDLRDLELAKYRLSEMIDEEEYNFETTDASLQEPEESNYRSYYDQDTRVAPSSAPSFTGFFVFGLLCVLFGLFICYLASRTAGFLNFLGIAFIIVGLLTWVFGAENVTSTKAQTKKLKEEIAKNREEIRKANAEIRRHNEQEKKRLKDNELQRQLLRTQYTEEWMQRKAYLQNEVEKINGLLSESYSLNILPAPYRNIQSVYYIYDYMSTSQASFNETLMHEHLENGFERILDRLDTIVSNQGKQIFHLRAMEAQNQRQIEQTQNVLYQLDEMDRNNQAAFSTVQSSLHGVQSSLNGIQSSSAQTSQYAAIAARYSAVNAYFNFADYLKKD